MIPDNLWDIDQWIAATIRDSFQKIEAETATKGTSTASDGESS